MNRIDKHEYFMNIAFAVSLRSTCLRRKVGAIIVNDMSQVLATGYNGSPCGMGNCVDNPELCYRSKHNIPSGQDLHLCRANHSEVNAIMSALKTGENLKGATMYVTTHPCSNCAKMIIQAGIKEVYYIEGYEDEFSKHLLEEAGVKLVKMDGSIYRAPEGASYKTVNDLDAIDPLVAQIYKFRPGTELFKINRDKVFKENNLYEYYDELVYYTDYKINKEIVPITKSTYDKIGVQIANRNELEYNGDHVKQLVVGAVVYDVYNKNFIFLKCKGERLKDKLTLVQGHLAYDENSRAKLLKTIMINNLKKELSEELTLKQKDILSIEPMYLIQTNDNKISSEHMGMISLVKIDTSELDYEIESGEPDKHDVEFMSMYSLSDLNKLDNLDTWARKVMMKMKEDKKEF